MLRTAQLATLITALAPPIVATAGFVTHAGVPQVGGAVLMTIGVWLTATLELRAAFNHDRPPLTRMLLGAPVLAIWIPGKGPSVGRRQQVGLVIPTPASRDR